MIRWLLFLLLAPLCLAAQPTSYKLGTKGLLTLALSKDFLDQDKVRSQLDSGLTTTLAITLEARSSTARFLGSCRIDIRFEPWDRVYFVTLWNVFGSIQKLQIDSYEALVAWFASYPLPLAKIGNKAVWELQTTIDILPFSQHEAERTQRWFHEHLGNQSSERNDPNKVLDLLVTSSIRRKPLIRYSYKSEFRSW